MTTFNQSYTHRVLYTAFGTPLPAHDEGEIPLTWRLRNCDGETCEIVNDGTHVVELHNRLFEGYFDDMELSAPTDLSAQITRSSDDAVRGDETE